MKSSEAYGSLVAFGRPFVETREAAARFGASPAAASKTLRVLENAGLVQRVRRGLWALDRDADPFVAAPYLTAPFPAYVSLWSALARHDMIEQIPRSVYVVSLDRSKRIDTSLGAFSIHHIAPELFTGFDGSADSGYLATPEKALFDTIYIRAPRGGHVYFPELALPAGFDMAMVEGWTEMVAPPRLRTIVAREVDAVLR